MRDEFSDELDETPNGTDSRRSDAIDGNSGAGNDPFGDTPVNRGGRTSTRSRGTHRNAGKRASDDASGSVGSIRTPDARSGNGDGIEHATEPGSGARNTDRGAAAGNGTGDGGRNANDDPAETRTGPSGVHSFRIDEPKRVGYNDLGHDRKRGEKFDVEILKLGVDFLFTAPTLLLPQGTADHWPLSEPESDELAKRLQTLMAALPSKKKTRLMKVLEQYGPWIMFAVSAGMITYPRVQATRKLLKQQSQNAQSSSASDDANPESRFRRYPNFNAARNAANGGTNGRPNGAPGDRGSGLFTFDVGPEAF